MLGEGALWGVDRGAFFDIFSSYRIFFLWYLFKAYAVKELPMELYVEVFGEMTNRVHTDYYPNKLLYTS